ncbi:hypothetical protein ABD77_22440 [Brevibacillus formosus]|nr:hypothetical protein [Brevibacillus formosus]
MVGWGDFKWYHIVLMPPVGLLEAIRRAFCGEFATLKRDWRGLLICIFFTSVEIGIIWLLAWIITVIAS